MAQTSALRQRVDLRGWRTPKDYVGDGVLLYRDQKEGLTGKPNGKQREVVDVRWG